MGNKQADIVEFFKNINWDHFNSMSEEDQDELMTGQGLTATDISALRSGNIDDIVTWLGNSAPPVIRPFWA